MMPVLGILQQAIPTAVRKRVALRQSTREALVAYSFLVPMALVLLTMLAYPVVNALFLALTDKRVGQPAVFTGLDNFRRLFADVKFGLVARNSVIYAVVVVGGRLILGMIMALILNSRIVFRNLFRGWLLIPWVTPELIGALTWRWLLQPRGLANRLLIDLGLIEESIVFLGVPGIVLVSIILVGIWSGFPFFGLSILAGMQGIPTELYEAADVDGASAWQSFLHVTLPGLRSVLVVTTSLSTIWVLNGFSRIWLLTGGEPANHSDIIVTYAYKMALRGGQLGYGAAISLIWVPILLVAVSLVAPSLIEEKE